jgi:hypothetical protein
MGKVKKKPPTKRILFDDLRLNRAVVEIRYPKGYLYWDVCGRCVLEINSKSGEQIDFLRLGADECVLRFLEHPKAQATFGVKHVTLSDTELKNLNLFKEKGPLILEVIKTHLDIQEISRAGFRLFYVLGRDSLDEAQKFVNELGLCSVSAQRFKGFANEVVITEPTIEASDKEISVRVRMNAVRRTDSEELRAEFNEYAPRYGVLIDLDFFRENIKADGFDLGQFIHSSEKKIKDHIAHILNR